MRQNPHAIFLIQGIVMADLMKVAGFVPMPGQNQDGDRMGASSFDPCPDMLSPAPIQEDPTKS